LRPDADTFLAAIRRAGKRVVMITNAHRDSLSLKLERIELAPYFERLISSHDYGFPKENAQFWEALQADIGFDPARSLFIDDTLPILRSAQRFGVAHLLAVSEPDSRKGPKDTAEFAAVGDYRDLIAGL
jgi:putative hydrolase of the HAD superfamily